jgi:hypothetical protein
MDIATGALDVKPNTSNSHGWKYYADEINKTWHKSAAIFIQCGQLLIDGKAELQSDAFNAMLKNKLDFDRTVGTKLMAVAANPTLCAHVHKLPPCWGTLYELSQLKDDVLKAKLADGTISPRMLRKDALALKPKKAGKTASTSKTTSSQVGTAWTSASKDQRREFLDKLGRAGLCDAMSKKLKTEFEDVVNRATIAAASETAPFAIYATGKLHCALRCAEEPDQEEYRKLMVGALGCIIKKAEAKGITRSRIVIAEGKAKIRK